MDLDERGGVALALKESYGSDSLCLSSMRGRGSVPGGGGAVVLAREVANPEAHGRRQGDGRSNPGEERQKNAGKKLGKKYLPPSLHSTNKIGLSSS